MARSALKLSTRKSRLVNSYDAGTDKHRNDLEFDMVNSAQGVSHHRDL
jgi:hypothetical protein